MESREDAPEFIMPVISNICTDINDLQWISDDEEDVDVESFDLYTEQSTSCQMAMSGNPEKNSEDNVVVVESNQMAAYVNHDYEDDMIVVNSNQGCIHGNHDSKSEDTVVVDSRPTQVSTFVNRDYRSEDDVTVVNSNQVSMSVNHNYKSEGAVTVDSRPTQVSTDVNHDCKNEAVVILVDSMLDSQPDARNAKEDVRENETDLKMNCVDITGHMTNIQKDVKDRIEDGMNVKRGNEIKIKTERDWMQVTDSDSVHFDILDDEVKEEKVKDHDDGVTRWAVNAENMPMKTEHCSGDFDHLTEEVKVERMKDQDDGATSLVVETKNMQMKIESCSGDSDNLTEKVKEKHLGDDDNGVTRWVVDTENVRMKKENCGVDTGTLTKKVKVEGVKDQDDGATKWVVNTQREREVCSVDLDNLNDRVKEERVKYHDETATKRVVNTQNMQRKMDHEDKESVVEDKTEVSSEIPKYFIHNVNDADSSNPVSSNDLPSTSAHDSMTAVAACGQIIESESTESTCQGPQGVKVGKHFRRLISLCKTKRCNLIYCEVCQAVFKDAMEFAKHFARVACVYPIVCHICLLKVVSAKAFIEHLFTAHPFGFVCECGQGFQTKDYCQLYLHSRNCRLGHPYLRKNSLTMTLHEGTKVAVLMLMKASWNDIESGDYEWDWTDSVTSRTECRTLSVTVHRKKGHQVELEAPPSDDYQYVLGDAFVRELQMAPEEVEQQQLPYLAAMHETVHSQLKVNDRRMQKSSEVLRKLQLHSSTFSIFLCSSCGSQRASAHELILHLVGNRCIHPLVCHICNIAFTQIDSFHIHMHLHRPLSCCCKKSFEQYMELFIHSLHCPQGHPVIKQNCYAKSTQDSTGSTSWEMKKFGMETFNSEESYIAKTFFSFQHLSFGNDQLAVVVMMLTAEAFDWKRRNRPPLPADGFSEWKDIPIQSVLRNCVSQCMVSDFACDGKAEVMSLLTANQQCVDFACACCLQMFSSREVYLQHLELGLCMHVFPCHICKDGFPTRELFTEHMLSHTVSGQLECKCSYRASLYLDLYIHTMSCSTAHQDVKKSMYARGVQLEDKVTYEAVSTKWSYLQTQQLFVSAKRGTIYCRPTLLLLVMTPDSWCFSKRRGKRYERLQQDVLKHPEMINFWIKLKEMTCQKVCATKKTRKKRAALFTPGSIQNAKRRKKRHEASVVATPERINNTRHQESAVSTRRSMRNTRHKNKSTLSATKTVRNTKHQKESSVSTPERIQNTTHEESAVSTRRSMRDRRHKKKGASSTLNHAEKRKITTRVPRREGRNKNYLGRYGDAFRCLDDFVKTKTRRIVCSACTLSFSMAKDIRMHFECNMCRLRLKCHVCQDRFHALQPFLQHMSQHESLVCACGTQFDTFISMYTHVKSCILADRAAIMQNIAQKKSGALTLDPIISITDIVCGKYWLDVTKSTQDGMETWTLNVVPIL